MTAEATCNIQAGNRVRIDLCMVQQQCNSGSDCCFCKLHGANVGRQQADGAAERNSTRRNGTGRTDFVKGKQRSDRIDQIAKWLDDRGGVPMLVIVDDEALGTLRLPNHAHADFVCPTATPNELKARAQRLMGEEETVTADDVLNIDNLEINLATYQVTLDNEPIDLTLMEYSLLSFLATHPNRAYSREVLLHRVWGFEYCGGTRTVDVHIRRIRSKVGPQIAAHITTVRGVGYLFKD